MALRVMGRAAAPLPYLVHVSDLKLQMSLDHIDKPVRWSIAAQLKLDLELVSLTLVSLAVGRSLHQHALHREGRYMVVRRKPNTSWRDRYISKKSTRLASDLGTPWRRKRSTGSTPIKVTVLLTSTGVAFSCTSRPFKMMAAENRKRDSGLNSRSRNSDRGAQTADL
jgi:hypothetical protein